MAYPRRQQSQTATATPARSGRPEKTTTGRFHFASAMMNGIIVRDGPVKRFSQRGTPWTQATILVNLFDNRQKKERERPAFVRVVAFNKQAEILAEFEKLQRVHVAGRLVIDMYQDRDGKVREGYELQADRVSRENFPKLETLLPAEAPGAEPEEDRDAGTQASGGGDPWPESGGQPASAYEDDIPF